MARVKHEPIVNTRSSGARVNPGSMDGAAS